MALGLVFDATYDELIGWRGPGSVRVAEARCSTHVARARVLLRLADAGQLRIGDRQHFLRYEDM